MKKTQPKTSVVGFFADKLAPEVWEGVAYEESLARLSIAAMEAAEVSGLSRREIARRMGHKSPSTVQRIVGAEADNVTVGSLIRFAQACGYELEVSFSSRHRRPARTEVLEVVSPSASGKVDLDLAA